jgi:hypothetical protein
MIDRLEARLGRAPRLVRILLSGVFVAGLLAVMMYCAKLPPGV